MSGADRAGSTPSKEVLRHANRVHAFLSSAGEELSRDRLAAEAGRMEAGGATVVVAGDINRGKSSLVNALLDRPGLVPVDVDVTTAVHVSIGFGRPQSARVTRVDPESGASRVDDIAVDDLVELVTVEGQTTASGEVGAAEVFVDHPLLERGLTLVDTPGVGGMSRGHRDITMSALARADAMVFVVSAIEPVTRSELEFLDEAGQRISNVILVASRADLGTADSTDAIMAEARSKIERLAELRDEAGDEAAAKRLRRIAAIDVIATSSFLADQAARRRERGRIDQAETYRKQSGIDAVGDRIAMSLDARDDVRLANLLQLIDALLAPVETALRDRLAALDGDPGVAADLEARRAELEVASGQQARWRGVLGAGITKMQTSIGRDVTRELTAVRDHYRTLLESDGDDVDFDQLSIDLQRSLQAAWANLADHAARQFDEVVAALLDELTIEGEGGVLGELAQPPGLAALGNQPGTEDRFGLLDDAVPLATQAFLYGNIANVMAGVLGVATGGIGLVAYGIGATIAAPIVMLRRRQREQRRRVGETQRAMNEALFGQEGLARELSTELNLRILDVRGELETMIEARLVARRKALETQLRELTELLRSATAERASDREQTARRLAEVRTLRGDTNRLAAAVEARLAALLRGEALPEAASDPSPTSRPGHSSGTI